MHKHTDTEYLEFLVKDGGALLRNGGDDNDWIYWHPNHRGRTHIDNHTMREALDAAMAGERNHPLTNRPL